MIYGIGTDIVRVARMQGGLERFGDALARRILSDAELVEFRVDKRRAHFLAKRFAAKEAVAKALGTGIRGGIKLSDIGVIHDAAGRPSLDYAGRTGQLLRELGVAGSHLSLADEHDYAIAFVVLLSDAS